MKAKRISSFYIFLLVLVILVLVGTEIGKSHLENLLEAYENSQYKYVAEDFLDTHFIPGNGEALAKLFNTQISKMETEESAAKALSALTEGTEFSLQSVSTGLNNAIEYVIKCDGKRFASLKLKESAQTDSYGFTHYEIDACKLNENLFSSFKLIAPVGYTVLINGNSVDDGFRFGGEFNTAMHDEIPGEVLGIPYTKYAFDALLSTPVFSVTSPLGTPAEITVLESGEYCAAYVFDNEMPAELQDYVINATKAYACYLQKDANFGSAAAYMDKGSRLYENLRTSPNWMVIDHDSYTFADAAVSEYYVYNDVAFSCRVQLTHILKRRGLQDYKDYIDITWYFTESNGKYLIYDSYNNN